LISEGAIKNIIFSLEYNQKLSRRNIMNTIELIKSRVSVRKYIDKEIPKEVLEDIIDCARFAPSGYNLQPWVFVVITDKDKLRDISEVCEYGRFIKNAGACIAVFCHQSGETLIEDASAATENIMIAALHYGLGTCWVNSHKKEHSKIIGNSLNAPEDYELMTLISIGYPDEQGNRPKKKLEEVIRFNSF
jgi:nitroreductase